MKTYYIMDDKNFEREVTNSLDEARELAWLLSLDNPKETFYIWSDDPGAVKPIEYASQESSEGIDFPASCG